MVSNGSDASVPGDSPRVARSATAREPVPERARRDERPPATGKESVPERPRRDQGPPATGKGRAPVIGLTTYLERTRYGVWDLRAGLLPQQYLDGVTGSGGVAVLLPPQPRVEAAAEAVLDGLDGLVLTGGLDVDPGLYGAKRHPLTDPPREDRDAWELALLRGAEQRGIPVFGICRGMQLINVAHGGTLHQHLPDALGTERYRIGNAEFATNVAVVDADSRLAEIVGDGEIEVHSYHHQGVERVGEGLVPTARTEDDLVYAFEAPGDSYLVAVQWHPEQNSEDRRLFSAVVAAASVYSDARASHFRQEVDA